MIDTVDIFLSESNHIEDEYSLDALNDAKAAWELICTFKYLTPDMILAVHKVLVYRLRPDIAGKLRDCNVRVGSRSCPSWQVIPRMLDSWLLNHSRASLDPSIRQAHVAFEKMHPFEDGNGRIGRIIMNWQRKRAGLPIEVIMADQRASYYRWFH